MILSAVIIDASSAYEYVEVEMSTTDRTVNTANALDMVDRIAVVRVHRVFYSGDVSMGMNRTNNITQTAECHVVVLPQRKCAFIFSHTNGYAHTLIHIHTYTHTCTHHTHARTHTHTHTHKHTNTHTCSTVHTNASPSILII